MLTRDIVRQPQTESGSIRLRSIVGLEQNLQDGWDYE